ncbi:MAG: hypothetical protein H6581_00715 [Bacteroidia bacterium]|nr:hypothetical protein [Bacteroidia bacterium]
MNKISAQIQSIETSQGLARVVLEQAGIRLQAILIGGDGQEVWFEVGQSVKAYFKENALLLGPENASPISTQNCFQAKIGNIIKGEIFTLVELDCPFGPIRSTIPSAAMTKLGLKPEGIITCWVPETEIMLSH